MQQQCGVGCPAMATHGQRAILGWGEAQFPEPPMPDPAPTFRKGTLAAIVGSLAAITLFTITPKDESGRAVKVELAPDSSPKITHVSGAQYLAAYLDVAGVATACDGVTTSVRIGQRFTPTQCVALLDRELIRHAEGVMHCSPALGQPGRDWQRVAAVSHAYQFGVARWCSSSAHDLIERGKMAEGCAALLLWSKAKVGGVLRPVEGVMRRAHRRQEYCRTGLPGFPVDTLQARLSRWN
jgi:lysozyme